MLASIILASKNEKDMVRKTLDSLRAAPCDTPYEIIVVDDGSSDGSCDFLRDGAQAYGAKYIRTGGIGLAPARNWGAAHATGDVIVFCDAHIAVDPHWLDHLARVIVEEGADAVCPALAGLEQENLPRRKINVLHIAKSGVRNAGRGGMCGKTMVSLLQSRWLPPQETAVEVPVLCGGCMAVKRAAFEAIGGYEPAFRSYGWDEEEIAIKLWTFGFTLKAVPYTCVRHQFRLRPPYRIQEADILHNLLYLAMCHYSDARVARLMEALAIDARVKQLSQHLFTQVFTSENIKNKRALYQQTRLHSDDWFFEKFHLAM